jgi:hypothetical protein
MVNAWSTHGQRMVNAWSTHGQRMVNTSYEHLEAPDAQRTIAASFNAG